MVKGQRRVILLVEDNRDEEMLTVRSLKERIAFTTKLWPHITEQKPAPAGRAR